MEILIQLGKIINIFFGKPKKVKDIVELINRKVGTGIPEYGKIKLRKDELKILYPDIKLAKNIEMEIFEFL